MSKKILNKVFEILLINIVMIIGTMGFTGCSSNKENDGKLNVVTTIFASYDFTRQIVKENGNVTMLLPPGAETHSYEPTPQDIIKISESDVFIYIGGENDQWVDEILDTIDTENIKIIKLMDLVETVEEEIVEGMEAEEDHEEGEATNDAHEHDEETEWDEHVWTSPKNAITISKALAKEFEEIDKDNTKVYEENLDSYVSTLTQLDSEFEEVINNSKRDVMIFGDRFPIRYFVEEYGLKYYAAFPGCSSETEASASTVAFLIDKVNQENIPVVFKIELSTGNIANTISEATGAKVLTFYACHNLSKEDFDNGKTYVDFMRDNLKNLKEALN